MYLFSTKPDLDPTRRSLEMFLTRTMRGLDCGLQRLRFQGHAPRDAIVCGQAEASVSRHDKVPPGQA
jgi:hypothetical protein